MTSWTSKAIANGHRMRWVAATLLLAAAAATGVRAQSPDERIRELERQVESLRGELRAQSGSNAGVEELERRIDILAAEIEKLKAGETAATSGDGLHGLGVSASKVYRKDHGVAFGGYGEVLYQNFDGKNDAGTASGLHDEADLLRAVLYVGYKFDDRWVLNSEIEFEHASTESNGAVSVEFAYLDYLHAAGLNVRSGLTLMPLGLVNELHEPTAFLGSRRPEVERALIPSTWSEIGAGIFGDLGPITYRTYLSTSLDASAFTAEGIREGRQGGSEAVAEDFGCSGRLDYAGLPGFVAGVSAFIGDTGQGLTTPAGASIGARTSIFDAHVDWRWRGLQVRGLAVRSSIDDAALLNDALALTGADSIGEEQDGGYVEAGYDILTELTKSRQSLVAFFRLETLDTQAEVPAGFARNPENDRDVRTFGFVYRPIDPIVFKLDYQDFRNAAGTATDQFNASFGWIF